MDTIDRTTLHQWLDFDADGELGEAEKRRLEAHLAEDAELRAERALLRSLHRELALDRIPVRADFKQQVMAALPAAPWERSRSAWRLPLAVMVLCSAAAAWLLAGSAPEHPAIGTGLAIVDFLQASALAGAGLLTASWRGLGMGLEEMFAGFDLGFFVLVGLVICLDLLFVTMLMRRSPRPKAARADAADEDREAAA